VKEQRRGVIWYLGFVVLAIIAIVLGFLISMALNFQASPALLWIALWLITLIFALLAAFRRGLAASVVIIVVGVSLFSLWWMSIKPTNQAEWQPDVAELLTGEFDPIQPSVVTLNNVRNFDWRTVTDFTERWETRKYDLDQIKTADLILTTWGNPAIAHTMISFGFANREHVTFSIGIRPKVGQSFSSVAGFFKVYGLIETAADERDVVRLRTSVQKGNIVHLYRLALPEHMLRSLLVEYVNLANDLAERPRFYRTVLANCTTMIWKLVDRFDPGLKLDYRILLTGYLPEYLYDRQALDMKFSLEQLEAMSVLPSDVPDLQDGVAYSAALRAGIPPL
jgi:hypothetical protein